MSARGFDAHAPGWLARARRCPSPNHDRRPATAVDTVVIHFISLPPGRFGLRPVEAFFCNRLDVRAHPSLAELGELRMDFQPHWPKPAGRVWAGVVPLPDGYPHRYVLLTMDRANFPDVKAPTWSYGALYFYGADAPPQTGGAPSPQ